MIVRAVLLFLIAMAVLAMFGKLRLPRLPGRRRGGKLAAARKCPECGAYTPGKGPCPCQTKR
ncbi:hypothetical protein GE300_17210 [Rhodobacteraceae bacterium 2CG4]|uniref:Uncharacterized protein n=1 Tax=Halovulum marinum TaxID=2662447 RepID=A0A6L5Z436_9RHOB|nr:hypothetical protein [Halovulum marinum]MSU91323.1 hypothetical protein [Halovulum marinum]